MLRPNVTRPGPLEFGCKPSTMSFSVGSDHNRSMRTTEPTSMVIEHARFSICSIWFIDWPMPPCRQMIFISIRAANGSQLNKRFILCQAQIPSRSSILSMHLIRKPKRALISVASWFPGVKWKFWGYQTFNAWKRVIILKLCWPQSTNLL